VLRTAISTLDAAANLIIKPPCRIIKPPCRVGGQEPLRRQPPRYSIAGQRLRGELMAFCQAVESTPKFGASRNGGLSERAGFGSLPDRLSGPGKGRLGADGTVWERCLRACQGPNGCILPTIGGQMLNSGLFAHIAGLSNRLKAAPHPVQLTNPVSSLTPSRGMDIVIWGNSEGRQP